MIRKGSVAFAIVLSAVFGAFACGGGDSGSDGGGSSSNEQAIQCKSLMDQGGTVHEDVCCDPGETTSINWSCGVKVAIGCVKADQCVFRSDDGTIGTCDPGLSCHDCKQSGVPPTGMDGWCQ